ncbi:MAG: hypothetical protein ACJ74W_19315 [Pyrinomonadaceae bacterium]
MRLRYGLLLFAFCLWAAAKPVAAQTQAPPTQLATTFLPPGQPAPAALELPVLVPPTPLLLPAPLPLKDKSKLYRAAYLDTYHILSTPNPCSEFFGGRVALIALNELAAQLTMSTFADSHIGMRMTGPTTIVHLNSTGQTYRRFAQAALNRTGSFFQDNNGSTHAAIPRVGSFAPNTRPARVLILLHELAHLIRRDDQQWLIPNDGLDEAQSERNTALVEAVCGAELTALAP